MERATLDSTKPGGSGVPGAGTNLALIPEAMYDHGSEMVCRIPTP